LDKLLAEDYLINNVRFFSSGRSGRTGEDLDCITLNVEMYQNNEEFFNAIKKTQINNFLLKNFQVYERC